MRLLPLRTAVVASNSLYIRSYHGVRCRGVPYPNSMSKRSLSQSIDLMATVSLLTSTTCAAKYETAQTRLT